MQSLANIGSLTLAKKFSSFTYLEKLQRATTWTALYDAQTGVYANVAADFESSNSEYLSKTSNSTLQTGDINFLFAVWAVPESLSSTMCVASKYNSQPEPDETEWLITYDQAQNKWRFAMFDGSSYLSAYSTAPSTGRADLIVGWHDPDEDKLYISVNGSAPVSAAIVGGTSVTTSDFRLGALKGSSGTVTTFFDGTLEHALFCKPPSSLGDGTAGSLAYEIIQALYNAGNGLPLTDVTSSQETTWGVVSGWTLSEESGTRYDVFGTNHLTDNNTVTVAGGYVNGLARDRNFARQFTAANSEYFTVASNSTLQTGVSFWGAAWVYLDSVGANRTIMSKLVAAGTTGEYVASYNHTSTTFRFGANDGGTFRSVDSTIGTPALNSWYFVFWNYVHADKKLRLSVNNGAFDEFTLTNGITANTTAFQIGALEGSQHMNGRIDGPCFGKSYTTSVDDIKESLWNGGVGKKYADLTSSEKSGWGLVSFWNFEEASGNAVDSHGSNNLTDTNTVTQAQGVNYYAGLVSLWEDQSGNGYHLTQTTLASRPLYVLESGKYYLLFDKTNDKLSNASLSVGGASALTWYHVAKWADTSSNQVNVQAQTAAFGNQVYLNEIYTYAEGAPGTKSGRVAFTSNAKQLFVSRFDGSGVGNGGRLKMWLNNIAKTLTFTGTVGATLPSSTGLDVGVAYGSSAAPTGMETQLIGVASALAHSDALREKIQNIINNYYGVY